MICLNITCCCIRSNNYCCVRGCVRGCCCRGWINLIYRKLNQKDIESQDSQNYFLTQARRISTKVGTQCAHDGYCARQT